MATYKNKQCPVPEMCGGCARDKKTTCLVITEPTFIYRTRGICFAKVDARRAKEIEKEIAFIYMGDRVRRGR